MQKESLETGIKLKFHNQLLTWYKNNKRGFPWRASKNPYETTIAEMMLQKTNAEKVEKVYPEFIEKYPDFKSLLKAPENDLSEALEYLGLQNQKVTNLKDLADKMVHKHKSRVPMDKVALLEVRGIGHYIANAILCFAFNKKVEIVDSGIARMLQRAFNIKSSKNSPVTDKYIWAQMKNLLPEENCKDFNYAILDFASKVCKRITPVCDLCFFKENCYYFKNKN